MKYRHFLTPPLADIDVLVTVLKDKKKVELPAGVEFLTEDLNALALRNRGTDQAETEEEAHGDNNLQEKGAAQKLWPKGRHIFLVGRRYDAWTEWPGEAEWTEK